MPGTCTANPDLYDLRRRHDLARLTATLLDRAEHLPPDDANLVRAVFGRGMTVSELARAAGVRTHTMSARLRRITTRLADPAFEAVLRQRDFWPPSMRDVATACILHGLTLRAAAARLGLSVGAVRRHRDAALALIAAVTRPRTPAGREEGAVA